MKWLNNLTDWLKSAKNPRFNLEKEIETQRLKQEKLMKILNTPDNWSEEKYLLEEEKTKRLLAFLTKEKRKLETQEETLKIVRKNNLEIKDN